MDHTTCAIVYSSNTGNTRQLAEVVQRTLGSAACYLGGPGDAVPQVKRLYIGFWTDKGSCDPTLTAFLQTLRNTEVFLFGTAGFGGDPAYFAQILDRVRQNLDSSVTVVGSFMCQGKMPASVRTRYEAMRGKPGVPDVDAMIANFDRAVTHPDADDCAALAQQVRDSLPL